MYETERYEGRMSVAQYLEDYVSIDEFLECCKECKNYGQVWSCPPYDFDVKSIWENYREIWVVATKIVFAEDTRKEITGIEAVEAYSRQVLQTEKQKLSEELWSLEKEHPGSISLSAGSCHLCQNCGRPEGKPCSDAAHMRYSIESLGGNVGKTCSQLLSIRLIWSQEGKLPEYYTLVSALLLP